MATINITGLRFGRLIAIRASHKVGPPRNTTYWIFKCDCGKKKVIGKSDVTSGKCKSCGCFKRDKFRAEAIERFWVAVQKTKSCWNWTACCLPNGYGRWIGSYAHREAYKMLIGPIPNKLHVLHKCDNRRCVNPKHLFLGTHQDNIADMVAKGRGVKGETQGGSKLTTAMVLEILDRRNAGETFLSIAKDYPVAPAQIGRICRKERWAHIKERHSL